MREKKWILGGIALAAVYWGFESSIHLYFFGETAFDVIPQDRNELWMRSLIALLFIVSGALAQYYTAKVRAAEERRKKLVAHIENVFGNTFVGLRLLADELRSEEESVQAVRKTLVGTIEDAITELDGLRTAVVTEVRGKRAR